MCIYIYICKHMYVPPGNEGNNSEGKPRGCLYTKRETTHHQNGAPQRPHLPQTKAHHPRRRHRRPQAPQPPPHPEPPPHHVRHHPSRRPRHYVRQPEARRDRPRRLHVHSKPLVEILRNNIISRQLHSEAEPIRQPQNPPSVILQPV